ncbi:hypothetical protein C0991_005225 [Blastosporella zonata]|nr:hypothetical protein C0991_005225 [Blastosporella zonata]
MAYDDDEVSDLTNISEDDEYKAGSSKNRTGRASSPGHYRIRNALKVPRATTYTTQALYDQIHNDDIKLDPEYQRDVVWPDTKMIGLIDSVFRNFYVPPVIFSVVIHDDGSEKRICIDGKQRLTSIQRFMDGLIPHKDPRSLTNQKFWYTDTGAGGKKKMLPQKYRKLFATKQIVCVEYNDVTDHDEREIFQRVQLGMALTPAEKLQVTHTPRSTFIRSLLSHFLSSAPSSSLDGAGSLAHFDWDRGRGADFRCIAQIVFCLFTYPAFPPSGKSVDPKASNVLKGLGAITQLEKFLAEPVPFAPEFETKVRAALRVMGAIAVDDGTFGMGTERMEVRAVFRTPTKLAPVEIVLTGLLVGVHMAAAGATGEVPPKKEARKDTEAREEKEAEGRKRLAEGISQMRKDVRETHVDIRMNTRVSKTMVEFVRAWCPTSSSTPASMAPSSPSTGKRKRPKNERSSAEDGEVATDEETKKQKVEVEDDDVEIPLRNLMFKKVPRAPPPPQAPPAPPAPPLPPKPLHMPASAWSKHDRMASLRAAKMQTQSINTSAGPPPATPPLPSADWGQLTSPKIEWGSEYGTNANATTGGSNEWGN